MHEFSLVEALFEEVDRWTRDHPTAVVESVRVRVGPLANVEPTIFRLAFEQLAALRTPTPRLELEEEPLTVACLNCGQVTEAVPQRLHCRQCGATDVRVQTGDRILLLSLTLLYPKSSFFVEDTRCEKPSP